MKQYKDRSFEDMDWIIDCLEKENLSQIRKWGIQERTAFEWLAYAMEELGELAEAIIEHEYRQCPKEKVISEAVQAATLLLKIAEMYKKGE